MNSNEPVILLFFSDFDRILRLLYHGARPPEIQFLLCECGRVANLVDSDAQAIGWQLLPHPMCPGCLARESYDGPARERFVAMVNVLLEQKARKV